MTRFPELEIANRIVSTKSNPKWSKPRGCQQRSQQQRGDRSCCGEGETSACGGSHGAKIPGRKRHIFRRIFFLSMTDFQGPLKMKHHNTLGVTSDGNDWRCVFYASFSRYEVGQGHLINEKQASQ